MQKKNPFNLKLLYATGPRTISMLSIVEDTVLFSLFEHWIQASCLLVSNAFLKFPSITRLLRKTKVTGVDPDVIVKNNVPG